MLSNLAKVLPGHGKVLIIPHDYPDPDALASSAALQLLLAKRYNLHGQIIFSGIVSRAENREILRHFKYGLTPALQCYHGKEKCPAIFVDTAPWRGNVTVPSSIKPIAVFDHHHGRYKTPANMVIDINPAFGATSTRLWEYLRTANIPIPKWLAAIMAYAITTETFDFIRHATERDIRAYTFLLNRCNMKILGQIKNAPVPRAYYSYLAEAVVNAQTYGRAAWTHLAGVKQPEIVAEIADLLLRMERIRWAFCTGFTDDRLIVSIRSEVVSLHCGRLLRSLIGRKEGSAGGHEQAAAGFIDVSKLSATERIQRRDALEVKLLAKIEGRLSDTARPLLSSDN
ncbi:MAG: DHH family phosphoesterase [Kiritimatiellia bacterium]|nr:DHH family phosphoesterase [Kiritimatiellia bacterium]